LADWWTKNIGLHTGAALAAVIKSRAKIFINTFLNGNPYSKYVMQSFSTHRRRIRMPFPHFEKRDLTFAVPLQFLTF
jgi:hypothetical protein